MTERVVMLVPGGFEHAGGIGRWAAYLDHAWHHQALSPGLEVLDTRGHGHAGRAAASFATALARLIRLRRAGELGSIHANLSKGGSTVRKLIVGRLARALRVPLVLHLHGSGYDAYYARQPRALQARIRALFARADRILVLGRYWSDWVIGTLGADPARVRILYNGVASPPYPRQPADRPCHIVLLGRIGARKGVPELLEALASPVLRDRSWTATLAGDGEVDLFRAKVEALGLAGRVTLPGWLDAAAAQALLARADILVLPSHAENSPISIIEALAAEVAVVTTPVGTTPELLVDGESALFVPVGDAAALAGALARLVEDRALREGIAAAGQRVFAARLEIGGLARTLAGIHAELAGAAPC